MNPHPKLLALATAFALALTGTANAFQLSADVDWIPMQANGAGTGGQFYLTNITNLDTNTPAFGGSALGFCIEPYAPSPTTGNTYTYQTAELTGMFNLQNTPETGVAAVYWLMDNYLESHVLDTSAIPDPIRSDMSFAFEGVLTEILQDWDGSYANLNLDSGWWTVNSNNAGIYAEATSMLNALVSAAPLPDYTSMTYELDRIVTTGACDTQDMLIVTCTPIPEPSGALLLGITGLLGIMRRRRSRASA